MKIRILASAKQDLKDGYHFYDEQNKGLGSYFIDTLYSDIDSLLVNHGVHQEHFGYFRLLSKRFPFAIYYKFEKEEVFCKCNSGLQAKTSLDKEKIRQLIYITIPFTIYC